MLMGRLESAISDDRDFPASIEFEPVTKPRIYHMEKFPCEDVAAKLRLVDNNVFVGTTSG